MRRISSSISFFHFSSSSPSHQYSNFGKLCYSPFKNSQPTDDPQKLKHIAADVYKWATHHGARYYSFLAFPHTQGVAQKQQTLIKLQYLNATGTNPLSMASATHGLKISDILKGQGDGSSFPNGGLRATHTARGYFLWDWKSDLFINPINKVLYIPSLLVNHHGEALDDKTTFRKAQNFIQKQCKNLLNTLNIKSKGIFIGVGLEQQFFIISKQAYLNRLDLVQTGRTLIGAMPPLNQQLSTHYYGKMQSKIQSILSQAEQLLVQMGLPIKTRHKQVAPNQYQFCSVFENVSNAIDHNLIKMFIMKQVFDRHGLAPLWHEKPFRKINGSGKHLNWSLNYYAQNGKLRNLFNPQNYNDDLFKLFALIKLKAVLSNQQLYLASISVPGNQLRLGGHEAPPRIFSIFLGDSVTNMIQGLPQHQRVNLKQKISHLLTAMKQQDTDRNRTSPYAYTSNRFQFRAVGSSQNCYFPMTVILTTIGKEIEQVNRRLQGGESVSQIIQRLVAQTAAIRFNGDGYSSSWVQQAKNRRLYVNNSFTDNIANIKRHGKVLVDTGVYSQAQLQSKGNITEQTYIKTVQIESKTLSIMLNKNIIPRHYELLQKLPRFSTSEILLARSRKIESNLQSLVADAEYLDKVNKMLQVSLKQAEQIRTHIAQIGDRADASTAYLPQNESLPQIYQIFGRL